MLINDKVYSILKWTIQYFLPSIGTLYFTLTSIWGLPYGQQVLGTISAINIFIGVVVGISSSTYKKSGAGTDGVMLVDTSNPDKDVYLLQLNNEAIDLTKKEVISFKVNKSTKME